MLLDTGEVLDYHILLKFCQTSAKKNKRKHRKKVILNCYCHNMLSGTINFDRVCSSTISLKKRSVHAQKSCVLFNYETSTFCLWSKT